MKKVVYLMVMLLPVFLFATVFEIPVKAGGVEVPVVVTIGELMDKLPEDFDPVWDGLRVHVRGAQAEFQIEDVDGNGRISAPDFLVFLARDDAKIQIPDVSVARATFTPAFIVEKGANKWTVSSKDGNIAFEVSEKGLVKVTKFKDVSAALVDEVGAARVSGWPESTFYIDGNLGNHHEETSGNFRTVNIRVLDPGPVAVGIVARLESEKFRGLVQDLVIHVFKNGDILVDNKFRFMTYADMMKVQTMITRPIIPAFDDAIHILPVFRRLVWADQLNITPLEYWLERNAITYVNKVPYITFPAGSNMKPLWWGATYIFASMERFRSNFSPKGKVGIAEILPEIPVIYADYKKWLDSDGWVYESLEFRDGIFKWMPGEFDAYRSTTSVYSMKVEDMPNRYKAGDVVRHHRLYSLYNANDVESAIKWIEEKTKSFTSLKIGE